MEKLTRFKYLSDYYIDLLNVEKELKEKGIIKVSIGINNMLGFSLGKIEKVDNVFKEKFGIILEQMIILTEEDLQDYFNKIMTQYKDNYGNIYQKGDGFFSDKEIDRRLKMGDLINNSL